MTRARRIQGLGLALGLTLVAAACDDDFLTAVPPDQISDEIFWEQEKDAILAVNALYPMLNVIGEGNQRSSMALHLEAGSDNAWAQKSFDAWHNIGRATANSSTNVYANYWNNAYEAIQRANQIFANIDSIPEMDPALKTRLIGETHFHRAYHYNALVNLYGDVPLILTPMTLEQVRNEVTRAPRAQVVEQILSDLDAAIDVLPQSYDASEHGRATKGAALALEARAALYAASWEQNHNGDQGAAEQLYTTAAEAAKAVMDLGEYSLHPDYGELTRYAGNNSSEIILADKRQQNDRNHGSFGWLGPRSLEGGSDITPLRALVDSYQMTDGLAISESPLFDSDSPYENRDPRMYSTLLYPMASFGDIVYNSFPGSGTADEVRSDFNATSTGYQFIKYVDLADRNDRGNSGIHFILIRYADVLLMYAEAKIELNQIDASVYDAIDQVRTRGGMPAVDPGLSQSELRDVLRYERRAELALEGLRMFDIRRWKIAEDVMPGEHRGIDYLEGSQLRTIPADSRNFNESRDYLWPIPLREIELNPNMTQNPGY